MNWNRIYKNSESAMKFFLLKLEIFQILWRLFGQLMSTAESIWALNWNYFIDLIHFPFYMWFCVFWFQKSEFCQIKNFREILLVKVGEIQGGSRNFKRLYWSTEQKFNIWFPFCLKVIEFRQDKKGPKQKKMIPFTSKFIGVGDRIIPNIIIRPI